jgi:hypothetical protein
VIRTSTRTLSLIAALTLQAGCTGVDERRPRTDEAPPASLAEYEKRALPAALEHRVNIDFESKIRLVGYTLSSPGPVRPGDRLQLTFYWQRLGRLEPGWRLSTELLDARGRPFEGLKVDGALREVGARGEPALPPSAWRPGRIYVDRHSIEVPEKLGRRPFKGPRVTIAASVYHAAFHTENDDVRLNVLSGPSDAAGRGLVAHLATGLSRIAPDRKARRSKLRAARKRAERRVKRETP